MKKSFLFLLVLTSFSSFSQTDFAKIKMEKDADFKLAEKFVLEASNLVLSTPLGKNAQVDTASKFILSWMEGTPDFTFAMLADSPLLIKLNTENPGLSNVESAAETKFCIQNPTKAQDTDLIQIEGFKGMLEYAENPKNKVVMSETLKKFISIKNEGGLEKYLKQ